MSAHKQAHKQDRFIRVVGEIIDPSIGIMLMPDEPRAVAFVAAIGWAESRYLHDHQIGGPALSWWQIEPATHADIRQYLERHRPGILAEVHMRLVASLQNFMPDHSLLEFNHHYAAAMCRAFWLRFPERLPPSDDILAMANMWKRYYNTASGKGRETHFVAAVRPVWDALQVYLEERK